MEVSQGRMCSPSAVTCTLVLGTAFVSSVFLFHVTKLAVTGHPFLRKIHH